MSPRSVAHAVVGALLLCGCGPELTRGPVDFGAEPLLELVGAAGEHLALRTWPVVPERGVLAVRLDFTHPTAGALDGLRLSVTPWMPEHGHGASVVPTVREEGNGVYQVDNLYLSMPGQWQLRIGVSGPLSDQLTPVLQIP